MWRCTNCCWPPDHGDPDQVCLLLLLLLLPPLMCCWSGLASAVVFLVHPASEPSADKLLLLEGPLSAGRRCLVAINGPGRHPGLLAGPRKDRRDLEGADLAGPG